MLPRDPDILFSCLNTGLRDSGLSFPELCEEWDADPEETAALLAAAGYEYDAAARRFRPKQGSEQQ